MTKKNTISMITLFFIIIIFITVYIISHKKTDSKNKFQKVYPKIEDIQELVNTTGEIKPQNRVEIKPPIAGRIESIFFTEGNKVKKGDTLMLMSSTERAALLDTASNQGEKSKQYWENLYKPIPIIAPITGEVIVRNIEPGQTVDAQSIVLVLSNKLIIKANVDETDIGKIKLGQKANITLDAYPDSKILAKVSQIAFESQVVNNVTTYDVELITESIPNIFRSGMSVNIDIITQEKKNAILIPIESMIEKNNRKFVLIESENPENSEKNDPIKTQIETGIMNDGFVEVLKGVNKDDCLLIKKIDTNFKSKKTKKNPFMPDRSKMQNNSKGKKND